MAITSYFGGKNGFGMYQNIINEIPPHINYYEICLGSGAVLRHKKPAPGRNIGFEIVPAVAAAFDCSAGIVVKNECGISWLRRSLSKMSHADFIYIDPPYQLSTRKNKADKYWREWSDQEHMDLAQLLLTAPARVALSHYPRSVYADVLSSWRCKQFNSYTRSGKSIELLYMNYPSPTSLHDYGFLGSNKHDRQRIRRKIAALERKLLLLPHLERQAILTTLQQYGF